MFGEGIEIGLPNLKVDDLAAGGFQGLRLSQHLVSAFRL